MKSVFINDRFYWVVGTLIVLLLFSFGFPMLFPIVQILLLLFICVLIFDAFILYRRKSSFMASRSLPDQIGLGDDYEVIVSVENNYPFPVQVQLFDELPLQFQERDFMMELIVEKGESQALSYEVLPKERGEYLFGKLNVYISSPIALIQRRYVYDLDKMVKVYPSILQMKNMELMALSRISTLEGIKRLRRIGHNYEFEQIKEYVRGDDIRSINWKSTGKRHEIMVNQYQDERAQQVYLVIDKSRSMELRFNEMRYLDYAINSALVMANIALKKYDKAGLITFSNKAGATLKAERSRIQLRKILEQLYREKPSENEADYDLLLTLSRKMLYGRSLILLYSNFETMASLERILPYLRRLNKIHLLVFIFFEDEEIAKFANTPSTNIDAIYQRTLAGKYINEKRRMKAILQKHGIQTILTTPQKLSVSTLNKYLELKAKGLI
jgi:uncharacterized protein (DUF58 family)